MIPMFEDKILCICQELFGFTEGVRVSIPDYAHGHLTTNALMVGAKKLKLDIGLAFNQLKEKLTQLPGIDSITLDGGFCNIRLTDSVIFENISQILQMQSLYGSLTNNSEIKVNIEYISANPTGPLHLGHLRGLYGDVLANCLKFVGFDVTREYYINNAGNQVYVLGHSVYYQYCKLHGIEYPELTESYPGEHIVKIAQIIDDTKLYDWNIQSDRELFIETSIRYMLDLAKKELDLLSITYDVWRYESDVHKDESVKQAIDILEDKGLIVESILGEIKSKKGKMSNQEVKTLSIPDQAPKAITKADGSYSYFAGDLGYHFDKMKRGFNWIIDLFGADHDGHVNYLKKAVKSMRDDIRFDVIVCQIVDFKQNNQKMKFSKRGGIILRPSDILEYLPDPAILRLVIASKKPDTHFTVDLDQISKISMDNPFYYIQYAYARSCSVMKNGMKLYSNLDLDKYSPTHYTHEMTQLAYLLLQWPKEVKSMSQSLSVYMISAYLEKISTQFHGIWNIGHESELKRWIISDDQAITQSRLRLVLAFQYVLGAGLQILGIKPYNRMPDQNE